MNPHQKNKVDIAVSSPRYFHHHPTFAPSSIASNHEPAMHRSNTSLQSLSPDEQRLFRLYGKLPSKADHLAKHLKDRKYFDSGDYALSKAGKASSVDTGSVGSEHPLPENIPHLTSPSVSGVNGGAGNGNVQMGIAGGPASGSPVKESSFLNRETSVDELEGKENAQRGPASSISPLTVGEGIPIRR
jgi:hypothetical protein